MSGAYLPSLLDNVTFTARQKVRLGPQMDFRAAGGGLASLGQRDRIPVFPHNLRGLISDSFFMLTAGLVAPREKLASSDEQVLQVGT